MNRKKAKGWPLGGGGRTLFSIWQGMVNHRYGHLRTDGNVKGLIDNDVEDAYMGLNRKKNGLWSL